jgi:hypothetical protein
LQAAGLLLAEVFMVGAAAAGAEVLDVPALKRLLFDVFHEDIALFKEYCLQVIEVLICLKTPNPKLYLCGMLLGFST